jgi:hypothetical protein
MTEITVVRCKTTTNQTKLVPEKYWPKFGSAVAGRAGHIDVLYNAFCEYIQNSQIIVMFEITDIRMRQALQTNRCNSLDSVTANCDICFKLRQIDVWFVVT